MFVIGIIYKLWFFDLIGFGISFENLIFYFCILININWRIYMYILFVMVYFFLDNWLVVWFFYILGINFMLYGILLFISDILEM